MLMTYQQAPRPEIPGYSIDGVLGSGGMGTVYQGVDAEGRDVAIKFLHPGLAGDHDVRARLRREVATLHRVKGAQVAQVLDAELDAPQAFIVTELIEGQDLAESVAEHGPLDVGELASLAAGLAAALTSIHAVGVVHRDLKPGNVMLTDGGPVLIDFGISQILDDTRLTSTGLIAGTPGYVDPVVLQGAAPDELGDWWGWAALLVHAATGRPPYGAGSQMAVLTRVEAGRVDVAGLAPDVGALLTRALAPRPEDRIPPAQVIESLEALASGEPMPALPALTTVAPPTYPPRGSLPPSYPPGGGLPPTTAMPGHFEEYEESRRQNLVEAWPDLPTEPPAIVGSARPRSLATFALWAGLSAVGFIRPGLTLLVVVAGVILVAMLGSAGQQLRKRRNWYGRRRRDFLLLLLASPVHLFMGILKSSFGLLLGAFLGAIGWFVVSFAEPLLATPAGIAVLLFALWWTPSSEVVRDGTRMVLGVGGAPATGFWLILAGILITIVLVAADGSQLWDPLPQPPDLDVFGVS